MTLIEAVPNISEGRDPSVIQAAREAIESGGSTVLGIEPDADYNRTVLTYVGSHDEVVRSSVQLIRVASEHIDMRHHEGNHPRMGAVDVMPFVPLGETKTEEAQIAVDEVYEQLESTHLMFRYGNSAKMPSRSRLPNLRKGGYEGLKDRFLGGTWNNEETRHPDNWNGEWTEINEKFGAMAIGVRPVLIAYNVNVREEAPMASSVAAKVIRSSGFPIKAGSGSKFRVRGLLQSVQGYGGAVGITWHIPSIDEPLRSGSDEHTPRLRNHQVDHRAHGRRGKRKRDRGAGSSRFHVGSGEVVSRV